MMRFTLIVSLMTVICASYAQIYKWTDSQGVVHFSDTPHVGAETLDTQQPPNYAPPSRSIPSLPPAPSVIMMPNPVSKPKDGSYTKIAIAQPVDQATIRNPQGYIVVIATVEPKLSAGNTVQVLLDDKVQGSPQTKLVFQLNGIFRGAHSIAVQVLDANGNVLKTSPSITIFMQPPRVGMGR